MYSPLHSGLSANRLCQGAAELLVAAGADAGARNRHGGTPVHVAKCRAMLVRRWNIGKVSLSFSGLYAKMSLLVSALYAKCPC